MTRLNETALSPTFSRIKGFTLVELMISLVLGLLISAAALQVFYTVSVNSRRQEASSQLQDNSVFGFSQIQQHLRRTNYGARATDQHNEYFMNHNTPQGGVVLTAPNGSTALAGKWLNGNLSGLTLDGGAISKEWLSNSASSKSISNLKDINNSDQLTIQYQSGQDGIFDCEGSPIPKNFYVIERYFVRMDTTVKPSTPGLACASAIYHYDAQAAGKESGIDIKEYTVPGESTAKTNNLSGSGTIIIANVDYFRVMLGVSDSVNFATYPEKSNIAYIPIPATETVNVALNNKRIVSLQIGILARSNSPTVTSQNNSDLRFNIVDKVNTSLKDTAAKGPTYLRDVYESTILIRNARGGI